jgi:ribosomal protein S18 acetylase RimI-like enzyme
METNIEIICFKDELAEYFTGLNLAWLEKYFVVEPIDHEMLSNPGAYIIDKGGYIFFATLNEKIAGTFALIKISDSIYELSKMAVDETFQGKKIGNKMVVFCINEAKKLKAAKLILFSNTKLLPALHLYRKYGFREVEIGDSLYKRSDIKMELDIE